MLQDIETGISLEIALDQKSFPPPPFLFLSSLKIPSIHQVGAVRELLNSKGFRWWGGREGSSCWRALAKLRSLLPTPFPQSLICLVLSWYWNASEIIKILNSNRHGCTFSKSLYGYISCRIHSSALNPFSQYQLENFRVFQVEQKIPV